MVYGDILVHDAGMQVSFSTNTIVRSVPFSGFIDYNCAICVVNYRVFVSTIITVRSVYCTNVL